MCTCVQQTEGGKSYPPKNQLISKLASCFLLSWVAPAMRGIPLVGFQAGAHPQLQLSDPAHLFIFSWNCLFLFSFFYRENSAEPELSGPLLHMRAGCVCTLSNHVSTFDSGDSGRESASVLAVPASAEGWSLQGHGLWTLNVTVTKTEI